MRLALILAIGLIVIATTPAHADEAIAPETIVAIKAATVYVRVEGDGWSGSGSGFVVAADKDRVLVATNHHVAVKLPPGARPKTPTVSVVFASGTKAEREYPAVVVGADEDRDLAVLRVAGVKDPPKPIAYADPPKPVETMGVFSFGFPFGQALSTGKGFPAVTVGKASVSSLREGADGELAVIQIDGNLNPGNSGGPVVDAKGRLIGVAVARIKDGQGIGFLIPAAEVGRIMVGRMGRVRVVTGKGADGKPTARIEAEMIDPAGAVRNATAYYVVVPPKGKAPDAVALDKHPDARKLVLKVEKGVAAGELTIEKAEGMVVVQVIGDRGAGVDPVATRTRGYSLAPGVKPEDLAGPPPSGWKEYTPPGKAFSVWLPEKPAKQSDEKRKVLLGKEAFAASGVVGKTEDGLVYRAETIELPPAVARLGAKLYPAIRNSLRLETKGRLTESVEAESGTLSGAEFQLESESDVTRVRVYIQGRRIYMVRVVGTAAQVTTADAESILISFRKPGEVQAKLPGTPTPGQATDPKVIPVGKGPYILGSIEHDPKFKTVGPEGAILIGLEVRFGKFGSTDIARAVRPIYRVNGKEEFGKQFGNNLTGSVTLKAKEGYAVGGITGKAGWWCNGFSLTFMKVKEDGTLDQKDSYESEWVGFDGKSDVFRVMGDGAPVIGIVGKIVGTETTALGLIFKGQEKFDLGIPDGSPANPKVFLAGKEPAIIAGGRAPTFMDAAPDTGVLIGLELSLGTFGTEDNIQAVRPIYRVNNEEKLGDQRGERLDRVVTLKAKAGYAVGAFTYKYGGNFDGCLLTFMKVKEDGTLDPKDSYNSEWVGWKGNAQSGRIDGEGKPVVGIVGRWSGKQITGFGLMFRGQTFTPPAKKK